MADPAPAVRAGQDALPPAGGRHPPTIRRKQPQDTAAGCRIRAEADLLLASAADTDNGRRRFAHSAVSWTTRGDLLQRLEASHNALVAGRTTQCPG